jgi:hypothetical protein
MAYILLNIFHLEAIMSVGDVFETLIFRFLKIPL